MLRVRPIHFTSALEDYATQLESQGLRCVENSGDWRVFDSGNGKVGVHVAEAGSAEDGTTALGFEVRDHVIFIRRTLEDGTQAALEDSRHGSTARVTAPDGFTFLADPVTDLSLPDPSSLPAVIALWRTPDTVAASTVMANIGAKFVAERSDGGTLFRAKNGGFVLTAPGEVAGVELLITHDGALLASVPGTNPSAVLTRGCDGRGMHEVELEI